MLHRNKGDGWQQGAPKPHAITSPIPTSFGDKTMLTTDQIFAAQKANFETLFGLTNKAFEGVEKLVELNLQAARSALGEASDTARAALSVKDAQELMALQASLLQPTAEKAAAYSRHVYDIATSTNADVARAAETQFAEAQKKFGQLVDAAAKNAPAGSENAVALYKSALAAANNAIEGVQKAAKQAADVAEANLNALSDNAAKVVKSTTKAKR
jgi:phasin family protein